MGEVAQIGTRSTCRHCGRAVWFRKAGVMGTSGAHPGETVYQWCGRKGSKPRPLVCSESDQGHEVTGYATAMFRMEES